MSDDSAGRRVPSGLEALEMIRDGHIDHPSMAYTLGFRLTEVSEGRAVISGTTSKDYCNPNGTIHGAWPAALLDSCMGSSIHSTLPPGAEFTVVEFKIDLLRSITVDTGAVKAEGVVAKVGRQLGWANGVLSDKDGNVLAKGTTTCLIRQPAGD